MAAAEPPRYFRLVRNWFRGIVQWELPVAFVAQLPCQPQTQVIVWSRCLYWSMTCRSGSGSPVREAGRDRESGRPFTGTPGHLGPRQGTRGGATNWDSLFLRIFASSPAWRE